MKYLRVLAMFLPIVLLGAAAVWLYFNLEARLETRACAIYVEDCRREAKLLIDDPLSGEECVRPLGLRMMNRVDGVKFGCGKIGDGEADSVWVEFKPGRIRHRESESEIVPVRRLVRYGLAAAIAVLFAAVVWGVWSFKRDTRDRDDFLAAASHDLMTPLVCLRFGYDRDLVERLIRQTQNISDFLRSGGRAAKLRMSVFPLVRAIDQAYSIYASAFADEESGPVAIDADPALEVEADEDLTIRIFCNLFGNALKYAAPYGPVALSVRREGGEILSELRDEGLGMTAWQRWRCFARYYRARKVCESGKGGFGIGLGVARTFARRMGGNLAVFANRPRGSRFVLTLPAAKGGKAIS